MNEQPHIPVLLNEAISALQVVAGEWYIDATFGGGGHSRQILEKGGKVIAFDWDDQAIQAGTASNKEHIADSSLTLVNENFSKLHEEVERRYPNLVGAISGILFDFGTSTTQLMSSDRGFSFDGDGILDMRMDRRLGVMAKDILAVVPEKQLAQLFLVEGGDYDARRIAKAIKSSPTPITTTRELAGLVTRVKHGRSGKLHPATKVFQALRIAVNSELTNIEGALPQAYRLLKSDGRLVTIAFHEGEDRIVKHLLRQWDEKGLGTVLTKSVITPSEEEVLANPRSRSGKLRIFKKK